MEDVELDTLVSQNKDQQKKDRKFNNSNRNNNNNFRKSANYGNRRQFNNRRSNNNNNNNNNNTSNYRKPQGNRQGGFKSFNNQKPENVYRVRIDNLHYSVGEEELKGEFQKYGEFRRCKIDWDKSGRSKESATIDFLFEEDAQRAVDECNNQKFQGQIITAYLKEVQEGRRGIQRTGGFKRKQRRY